MKIEINKLVADKIDFEFLKRIADKAAKLVKLNIPELSIVLVGDAKIKSLNTKYRKKNRITDVLAFDYGEIIICLPQAKRQAKELKHSLKKELAILLVHGILHLAGYNDETVDGYNAMTKMQNKIIKNLWPSTIS